VHGGRTEKNKGKQFQRKYTLLKNGEDQVGGDGCLPKKGKSYSVGQGGSGVEHKNFISLSHVKKKKEVQRKKKQVQSPPVKPTLRMQSISEYHPELDSEKKKGGKGGGN